MESADDHEGARSSQPNDSVNHRCCAPAVGHRRAMLHNLHVPRWHLKRPSTLPPEGSLTLRRRRGVCGWCRTAAQTRMSSRPVSPFLDLDLFLLARHLRRFRPADAQPAIVELGLDLRRVGMEPQWDRAAERAIAAFHHVPVLILVLLVTLR